MVAHPQAALSPHLPLPLVVAVQMAQDANACCCHLYDAFVTCTVRSHDHCCLCSTAAFTGFFLFAAFTAALPAALCNTLLCATALAKTIMCPFLKEGFPNNNSILVLVFQRNWAWLLPLQAILLVHQNKTTAALEVLEPLFEHIEPMQENVAIRVCLLLMELYLTGSNYAQAASKVSLLHCTLAEQQRLATLYL